MQSGVETELAIPAITNFEQSFRLFRSLIREKSGSPFVSFQTGISYQDEGYKIPLREEALSRLDLESWSEREIGTGAILRRVISAIEIPKSMTLPSNNLVFWDSRYGHEAREHRKLIDALADAELRQQNEQILYLLYQGPQEAQGDVFASMAEAFGARYTLLSYLFFLKDRERFAPVQPTGFDQAFEMLGVDFRTRGNCSWENYVTYNAILMEIRDLLAREADLEDVRLIDAHSFCWDLVKLTHQKANGDFGQASDRSQDRLRGISLKGIDLAVAHMISSMRSTSRQSGTTSLRRHKEKRFEMSYDKAEQFLRERLALQDYRCNLTGIPFHWPGDPGADPARFPSPDRTDSNGHYDPENVRPVCAFVNMWKNDMEEQEFIRLLRLVQGLHVVPA